jgi:class 3 adenylate cyclase/tetratricopeptide (TPR) repeat protein
VAACPACGKELPGEFPFCPFCAAPLTAGPSSPSREERKVVSVLFCDLVGFTAASERVDPEDVRARLRPYHSRLREEIERFGGTVEKFVGDAVVAVFGAPTTHEDDAERAVRAALRILEAIAELNEGDADLGLEVRIGINTGEAVVSLGAHPELGEGFVAGDVVNTASRLQGIAPVDGVVVSEPTFRQTEQVFEYELLEPVRVKGKSKPLPIFRPRRARAEFGRDVIRTHTTPLIGRDLERSLLVGTFERAAQRRSCQLVTLVGEPGVGKSRMVGELLRHVDGRPGLTRWRQGRCLPYGEGIAFWALGEIVKAEAGILESDTPAEVAAKLEHAVPNGDPERAWLLARVAPLVGAPGEPVAQEESFAAWRRFCEGLAAERTTVLVFEDLHWADPALLAFLEYLADWAEGVPLLLLCTARPELYEQHPTFGANARNEQRVNLAPLSDDETAQLVSSLLQRVVLAAETQQRLLEQAGGNPLYAEEFVRLLGERGRLGKAFDVPDSVQALIAARLDTLAPDRKSLLQDASVLGKVFWAGAVAAMGARDPRDVELALHELARKELVRPARSSSMDGDHEFGFWHVLVRDVCYGQIPRAARASRHRLAAAWIEEKAGERVEDLADVLAYHYQAALELSEAAGVAEQQEELRAQIVRYLILAGERALSLDIGQAERQLARALDLCPEDAPQRALLLERLGQATQQLGRLRDARQMLERALALHRAAGDVVAAGRVLTRIANIVHRLGDPQCEGLFAEAVQLLESRPAGPELVAAYTYAAGRRMFTDDDAEAIAGADRALALAAEVGLPEPAFALHIRGLARCHLGDARGVDDLREALRLALEQGLGRETAVIQGNLSGATWVFQGPAAALEVLEDAIAFSERRGMTEMVMQNRSGVPSFRAELGRVEEALAEAGPLADAIEANGDMSWLSLRALQLRLLAETGAHRLAPDPEPLLAAGRESGLPDTIADAVAASAQLHLALGRPEEGRALLRELGRNPAARPALLYASVRPQLMRTALSLDEIELARRLVDGIEPRTPPELHALVSCRAQLAEAGGEQMEGAALYADAAGRWREFGDVPEYAYALLGRGRCLVALGDAAAEAPLAEARDLFARMGYKPALAEAESLLADGLTPHREQRING